MTAARRSRGPAAFRHVLVPLDLSGRHGRVLRTAAALARPGGGGVTLLHVVQRIADIPFAEVRKFYESLVERARAHLEGMAARLARAGTESRVAVVVGEPAAEIVRYAQARGVDLIVLGSHRVEPGRPGRGWGTTSYKVGVLCRCPVLLVK